MDRFFYDEWLLVGMPEHKYSKPFPTVKLSPSDSVKRSAPAELAPGHWCRYANRLRNNNSYQNLSIAGQPQFTLKKIAGSKVDALFTCGSSLLVQNYDSWVLFDNKTLEKISEGEWYENGSTFFSVGSKFFAIQRKLDEISSTGKLLSRTRGMSAEDLRFHEVAYIGDKVIIAGYQTYPDLPEPIDPFGFIQSVPKDGFTEPRPKTNQRKIKKSNTISFFEDTPIIPVYLEDKVIQPLLGRIAIFNYDMEVIRVVEGKFEPNSVSAGLDSILYMSGIEKNSQKIYAFDVEGHLICETDVPRGLGDVVSPPLVSRDNTLFWVGTHGIAAFNGAGKMLWTHKLNRSTKSSVYPLLYNDVLTACFDSECRAWNKTGELIFSFNNIEGSISTPLVSHGKDIFFLGTSSGLYKIERLE